MEQARLTDGKAIYDDSFPVALDERLQKINALDAKKLKQRVPNARFYCPKCYKLDPSNKTEVYPSAHETPRFNRIHGEAHLDSCQYKNAGQYLSYISQKIQVNINGKEIELSLMPYEGRGINNKPLGTKIKYYCRPDNRKFMQLVRESLTDYEMQYFHKKYNSYKVHCYGGKPISFRKLFKSVEMAKVNTYPYEEKLNIIVGKIKSIKWNDHYIVIDMDSSRSPYELRLYLESFLYDSGSFSKLEGKRIACMGYIRKEKDNFYLMEIISTPHQIAFLDDDVSLADLSPSPSKKLPLFFKELTRGLRNIKPDDFYSSYYQYQLEKLQTSVTEEMGFLQESIRGMNKEESDIKDKLMKVKLDLTNLRDDLEKAEEKIITINDYLAEINRKITNIQITVSHLERESHGWWNWLINIIHRRTPRMIRSEIELNRSMIRDYEERRKLEQKRMNALNENVQALMNRVRSLESERLFLQERKNNIENQIFKFHSQIEELKRQLRLAKENVNLEREVKDAIKFNGEIYEFTINSDWSVLVDILIEHANLSLECSINSYLVQKKEDFYIPYEFYHKSYYPKPLTSKRISRSNQYYTFRNMAESVQNKLIEDINQLSALVTESVRTSY